MVGKIKPAHKIIKRDLSAQLRGALPRPSWPHDGHRDSGAGLALCPEWFETSVSLLETPQGKLSSGRGAGRNDPLKVQKREAGSPQPPAIAQGHLVCSAALTMPRGGLTAVCGLCLRPGAARSVSGCSSPG